MNEIEAAELARLRADATAFDQYSCLLMEKAQIIALLDALEKARGEADYLMTMEARDERDSARALLREAAEALEKYAPPTFATLRARISAELESKP